ncbi:hypothetical protein OB900_20435, partial [Escherichia coli]|nr:hypothetical protein [Escherichia coli]
SHRALSEHKTLSVSWSHYQNIVRGQYSELQNHHKTEALSQNNKYNEEKSVQERMPGADSPQELMKRAKEYQDKYK